MRHVGIVIGDHGSAIVTVERSAGDSLLVTGIERLPFDLSAVADRVRALTDPDARYVLDAEGLGSSLWTILDHKEDPNWRLYAGRGLERQALVDELLVATTEGRFQFAAGLAEQEPMSKALLSYRRQVRDDGAIGSELVVALLLALIPPPPVPQVLFAWGNLGRGRDDGIPADVRLGGIRFVRGPDGQMMGLVEKPPRP